MRILALLAFEVWSTEQITHVPLLSVAALIFLKNHISMVSQTHLKEGFMSEVIDILLFMALDVLDGVVEEGNTFMPDSTSNFTELVVEKSKPLLMGAVVSVG